MARESDQTIYPFKSHQMVCIEGKTAFLYGEVIQVIVERQFCWVRPLLLAEFSGLSASISNFSMPKQIIDLSEGSDLLLPISFFRPALDTEIIPLITQLSNIESDKEDKQRISKQLNCFVQEVWQANFQSEHS